VLREKKTLISTTFITNLSIGFERVRVIVRLREKNEVLVLSLGFILRFTKGITDELLNIIILNYFFGDSLSNFTLKFSFHTKNFKNPSIFFNIHR
jgi:hypothetical protein